MKIHPKDFLVKPGKKLKLKDCPTRIKPFYSSKEACVARLEEHVAQMKAAQSRLYADARHAVLIIFQAMDAGGKDSAISHVMSGVDPQGCQVFSFKAPSAEELSHDFLWRCVRCLPARGNITLFNRSYYEEVLIARVHPEILARQRLPDALAAGPHLWKHRFHSINEHEKHLARNGTTIVKLFLHLSKQEQRRRFLKRIDRPEKNWKITPDDIRERALWKHYTAAYQDCLESTSTKHAPWHCVPADDKANARLIISKIIIDTLRGLDIPAPHPDPAAQRQLRGLRRKLAVARA